MRLRNVAAALGVLITATKVHAAYWLEGIEHNGVAINHPNAANYSVFRNVRDYVSLIMQRL